MLFSQYFSYCVELVSVYFLKDGVKPNRKMVIQNWDCCRNQVSGSSPSSEIEVAMEGCRRMEGGGLAGHSQWEVNWDKVCPS